MFRTIFCPRRITCWFCGSFWFVTSYETDDDQGLVFTLGTLVGMIRHYGANSYVTRKGIVKIVSFPMRHDNALAVGPMYRDRLKNGP